MLVLADKYLISSGKIYMNTIKIVEDFELVVSHLKVLCCYLYNELLAYPLWIDNGEQHLISDRDKLIYVLMNFKPSEGLDAQETFRCMGAVGVSQTTIDYIQAVNHAKADFSNSMRAYMKTYDVKDTTFIRQLLASAGHPAVKLKQVFRQLMVISSHPRRIAFTQACNGSHKVISLQIAKERLFELGGGEYVDIQLAKLNLLKSDEKLVIHRQIKPHWVANISTFKNEQNRSQTKCFYTSLPIFYLHNWDLPLPTVVFSKKVNRQSEPRADKQIEDQPFLPSISAFRYKRYNSYRESTK